MVEHNKIGITGASGLIGSVLFPWLEKRGFSVVDFNSKNFDITNDNLEFPKNLDIVIHLAAMSSVYQSKKDPDSCRKVNVDGTYNVIKAMKKANIKKIIFTSSILVEREEETPYKGSKLEAENMIKNSGLCYVILRLATPLSLVIRKGPIYDLMNNKIYLHPISTISIVSMDKILERMYKAIQSKENSIESVIDEEISLIDLCTKFKYPVVRK